MNSETKPNLQQAVPFFMVSNMEASLRFYVNGLGFKMINQWSPRDKIEWCWLDRDGVAIMLQEPRNDFLQQEGTPGRGLSICFTCLDALALYQEFKANGLNPREPFVGNNRWVVILTDPDGYKLDFESVTDADEETKYLEWVK